MRSLHALPLVVALTVGCANPPVHSSAQPGKQPDRGAVVGAAAPARGARAAAPARGDPAAADLPARADLPPERRAIVVRGGQERVVDAAEAARAGYTLVSLREDWTPYIFRNIPGPDGAPLPNRYRAIFLGLATDTTDRDGQPLVTPPEGKTKGTAKRRRKPAAPPKPEHNYLELYGVPPTLAVLRTRFLEDAPDAQGKDRCAEVDREKLTAVPYVPVRDPKAERKYRARMAALRRRLEAQRRAARLKTLEELAQARPKAARDIEQVQREERARLAFAEAEKRLMCEGLLGPHDRPAHQRGFFDEGMRQAVIRFQHKHKIYEGTGLGRTTLAALARTLLENDQAILERVLTERAVSAADVLEDGSVDRLGPRGKPDEPRPKIPPKYRNAAGELVPVRNLAEEAARATLDQLGLTTPAASLAFFRRHPAADFQWLQAAITIPPPPEYYASHMDLSVVIDRGDVFYDPPYDENGQPRKQVRQHFPRLVLYLRYNGQTIPLVRWRTTIGGWRSELASNGYEYYRYKGSDIGTRVWRRVVAGPVWIAPASTPIWSLVKGKIVNGAWQRVVNYDELGPGYLSAYGLVAAYNVVPGQDGRADWDNGIRVHGSSEYRSIFARNGYSHGCHRLTNHLAIRLFSFVLQHRTVRVEGDLPLNFSRQFLYKDNVVMMMRLPTRGYHFVLEPPVPVNVLKGNICGTLQKPVEGYVPKPGVPYPPGPIPSVSNKPEDRAGGGGGGAEPEGGGNE